MRWSVVVLYMHAHTYARPHTTLMYTLAYAHTYTHACVHTCTHAHSHMQMHSCAVTVSGAFGHADVGGHGSGVDARSAAVAKKKFDALRLLTEITEFGRWLMFDANITVQVPNVVVALHALTH